MKNSTRLSLVFICIFVYLALEKNTIWNILSHRCILVQWSISTACSNALLQTIFTMYCPNIELARWCYFKNTACCALSVCTVSLSACFGFFGPTLCVIVVFELLCRRLACGMWLPVGNSGTARLDPSPTISSLISSVSVLRFVQCTQYASVILKSPEGLLCVWPICVHFLDRPCQKSFT